jgi:hypothetical protein
MPATGFTTRPIRTTADRRPRLKVVRSRRVQVTAGKVAVVNPLVAQSGEVEMLLPINLVGIVVLVVSLLLTVGWLVYLYR